MLLNRVLFRAASGGTGAFTVSTGVTGYATPAGAGAVDGTVYSYMAQSDDLSQWEVGYGVYTASGTTLARTTVFNNSSGLTTNINFTNAPIVSVTPTTLDFRDVLQAARTYYVRSDGSDSNNGLANTAGGAFLTLAHALLVVCSDLDFNNNTVTIMLGQVSTSWTTQFLLNSSWVGGGSLIFDGNGGTLTTSSGGDAGSAINVTCVLPGPFTFQNITLSTTGSGGSCVKHGGVGQIIVGTGVTFGASVGRHLWASSAGASIQATNSYTISGNCLIHLYAAGTGSFIYQQAAVTVSASITVSGNGFAYAQDGGGISSFSSTFSLGAFTVTGTRYSMNNGGIIETFGGGANYFPGTIAGPATLGATGFYA